MTDKTAHPADLRGEVASEATVVESASLGDDARRVGGAAGDLLRRLLVLRTNSMVVQFLRYGVVGGVAFAVDFGTLWAFTSIAKVHYLLSAVFGFFAGLVVNYWLSSYWVFDSPKGKSKIREFGVFALIGVAGVVINEIVMWLLTDRFGVHYLGSKAVAAWIVLLWNFLVRRALVFS